MTGARFQVETYLGRSEGQHFDRKSLWEGLPEAKRPRESGAVGDHVARYVAAFANADGGVLLMGVEDDGTVTGHGYSGAAVDAMLQAPVDRLEPPQPAGFRVRCQDHELLAFDIPMSSTPVLVVGDGYPLRIGDSTVQATVEQIAALKNRAWLESFEARPSARTFDDLDPALLERAQAGAGLPDLDPAEYLVRRRLADWRGPTLVLRQAAELLFCEGLPEHPNAGVRIFRVVGRERRTGLEHNVEELPRIEGALPRVLDEVTRVIHGLLRRPSRLTPSGHFRPTPEYPEFSWREAILNAVAHRDYAVFGRGVEVWLFDDRLEVTSPGGLVSEVRLEQLLTLERVHASRNPRLVRVLVDLGFMRVPEEGLPGVFADMAAHFLPRPELSVVADREVRLVLQNTPSLTSADRALISAMQEVELSAPETVPERRAEGA